MLLSLILPAYNTAKFIAECLDSIKNQEAMNPNDIEIIIVDDGSTDNTLETISLYKQHNPHLNITIIHKRNEGVSIARNVGLSKAIGDFVWFIDTDDYIHPYAYKYIHDVLISKNPTAVYLGEYIEGCLNENGFAYKFDPQVDTDCYEMMPAYRLLDNKYHNGHTLYIWKRAFLNSNNLHYPEYITINEDFFFVINALLEADTIYSNRTFKFYYYRFVKKSASRGWKPIDRTDRFLKDRITIISELKKRYIEYPTWAKEKQQYFDIQMLAITSDPVQHLLLSGTKLYLIKYYLYKLKKCGCYPMSKKAILHTKYYYSAFNIPTIFYLVSFLFRLPIIKIVRKLKRANK